ncbi:hypothetical protein SBADM41S_09616 [Streptomyces badius]
MHCRDPSPLRGSAAGARHDGGRARASPRCRGGRGTSSVEVSPSAGRDPDADTDTDPETDPVAGAEASPAPETESPAPHAPAVARRRPRRWGLIVGAATGAGMAAGLLAGMLVGAPESQGEPASRGSSAKCTGFECRNKDAQGMECHIGVWTAAAEKVDGIHLELRYSPRCGAAWARITEGRVGDTARVEGQHDHSAARAITYDRDTYSPMVEAPYPRPPGPAWSSRTGARRSAPRTAAPRRCPQRSPTSGSRREPPSARGRADGGWWSFGPSSIRRWWPWTPCSLRRTPSRAP